jgi:hypothetical protein
MAVIELFIGKPGTSDGKGIQSNVKIVQILGFDWKGLVH